MTDRDPRGGDALDREFDEALALAKDQGTYQRRPEAWSEGSEPWWDPAPQDPASQDPASPGRAAPQDPASRDRARARAPQDPAPQDPAPQDPTPRRERPSEAPAHHRPAHHRPGTPWPDARAIAARAPLRAAAKAAPVPRPLPEALGHVLAAPLTALTDLPSFDTSAMDGWALAGPGPWRLPATGHSILAGHAETDPLPDGHAIRIATGARVPPGATAVLRTEHGTAEHGTPGDGWLYAAPAHPVTPGQDIRPRGQECRSGDLLLPAGALITPVILGLAAAAGYDELPTVPRPRVEILVLGDELLRQGLPHDGRIRDALGPMLAPWLRALGAEPLATRRLADDAEALYEAVAGSTADVVLTTGGTAAGPVDHVHPTLRRLDAELLVDGVAVRPGHPMLLARLAPDKHLVGLPGNPLAAVSGLLTLAEPLLRTLTGRPVPTPCPAPLSAAVHGHPRDTRLVPVVFRDDEARPLRFNGPAMLRGIAVADGLAVIPPGGADRGGEVEVLDLPWATAWPGPQE
ncbi:molybdopterin molybdotransferase MoeA [Streptomyces sp. ME19-01-6]|uniref:molybdopterin molybdotransferase MoeA n=1 Tax=Streptomyces sp. ME19-01-6 TaxID=3028686 RepID=UPI0029BEA9DC|nr:molybdopterin molybdotransferase MoeA [Streptomyces sp. ME19-01-6]MDX3226915.1 molybdopterin molybdotransferase MoeA [Streptomyces sp. ME19-01-6]